MGGGGEEHGHGHGKPYEIPDWRIYRVEDVPELYQVQRMLAQKGLKDPWLRNEVWRFHPGFGTKKQRMKIFWTRGMKWGFALAVATVAVDKLLNAGHGGHDEHH